LLFSLPALLIPSSWRKRRREHKGERRDAMIKHGITKAMWRAGHRPPASP
jgi:hypothetical protein